MTRPRCTAGVSLHAVRRCEERFGFAPTRDEQRAIYRACADQAGLLACNTESGAEMWLVEVRQVLIKAVFNRRDRLVVTVMPPRWTTEHANACAAGPLQPKQRGRNARGRQRKDRRAPDPITEALQER